MLRPCRDGGGSSRSRAWLTGVGVVAALLSAGSTWPTIPSTDFVGAHAPALHPRRDCSLQATYDRVMNFDTAMYKTYDSYVHKRQKVAGLRIRLDRWGHAHKPHYKIHAIYQKTKAAKSTWYIERLGFYDPLREADDPMAFRLRLDRVVHWLRQGAQPTEMVANLLDRTGIIRRTGPHSRMGQWEWRVPKNCGPDPPEGWNWDGPQKVTWNSRPRRNTRRTKPRKVLPKDTPLVERYGFLGYEKIPVEFETLTQPAAAPKVWTTFRNTELPMLSD